MRCHDLHAHGTYPMVGPGIKPPPRTGLRSPRPGTGARVGAGAVRAPSVMGRSPSSMFFQRRTPRTDFRHAACPSLRLRHRSFPSILFRSSCSTAGSPAAGPLFRAYRARAGAPVGAGAVRAPDCARERADARLPSAPAGVFLRPRPLSCADTGLPKRKGGPGSRLSVLILPHFFPGQAPARKFFRKSGNRVRPPKRTHCRCRSRGRGPVDVPVQDRGGAAVGEPDFREPRGLGGGRAGVEDPAALRWGDQTSVSRAASAGVGRASRPRVFRRAAQSARSPAGQMSGRPAANSSQTSAVQRPTPLSAESAAIASSSGSRAIRRSETCPEARSSAIASA